MCKYKKLLKDKSFVKSVQGWNIHKNHEHNGKYKSGMGEFFGDLIIESAIDFFNSLFKVFQLFLVADRVFAAFL